MKLINYEIPLWIKYKGGKKDEWERKKGFCFFVGNRWSVY